MFNIYECTLEKNHINVNIVVKDSLKMVIYSGIYEYTLEKNRIDVNIVVNVNIVVYYNVYIDTVFWENLLVFTLRGN